MPRRRGVRPRLLAAVVRLNATLAFAAERQVVMPTEAPVSEARPGRFLTAIFAVVMSLAGAGLVIDFILKFRSGASFQRYKNWQGLWVSYGDMTVFLIVAFAAGIVGSIWSWVARRREERELIESYRKRKGAA
jgi:hypothetical protein